MAVQKQKPTPASTMNMLPNPQIHTCCVPPKDIHGSGSIHPSMINQLGTEAAHKPYRYMCLSSGSVGGQLSQVQGRTIYLPMRGGGSSCCTFLHIGSPTHVWACPDAAQIRDYLYSQRHPAGMLQDPDALLSKCCIYVQQQNWVTMSISNAGNHVYMVEQLIYEPGSGALAAWY